MDFADVTPGFEPGFDDDRQTVMRAHLREYFAAYMSRLSADASDEQKRMMIKATTRHLLDAVDAVCGIKDRMVDECRTIRGK